MTATVSVWVPLAVAGAGAITTFGAAILTRWADRHERRAQWRREDAFRWHQERQQAYAGLMAALDEWDRGLHSVTSALKVSALLHEHERERPEVDLDELTRLGTVARQAAALVELMAPKAVRSLAQAATRDRYQFRNSLVPRVLALPTSRSAGLADFTGIDAQWKRLRERTSSLRDAMRDDLGIESQAVDKANAGDGEGN